MEKENTEKKPVEVEEKKMKEGKVEEVKEENSNVKEEVAGGSGDGKIDEEKPAEDVKEPEKTGGEETVQVSNRVLLGIAIVVGLLIVGFFVFRGDGSVTGDVVQVGEEVDLSSPAAIVNGEVITIGELNSAFNSLPPQYQGSVSKSDLLNQLVQTKVVYQEAEKQGMIVGVEEAREQFEVVKLSSGLSEEQFAQSLQAQGISEEQLLDQYAKQLTVQNFMDENFLSDIKVSDKEIRDFYNENKEQFKVGEQVVVKHILIGDAEMSAEEQRAMADELLLELTEDNFCEFVEEHSTDVASVPNCGEYTFGRDDPFVEEFKQLAFEQDVGDMGIAETQFGSHIIWTVKQIPAKTSSLREVKEDIEELLKSQKAQEEYQSFYEEISGDSVIEIKFSGV